MLRYGEMSWTAALLPISVDGMIVASSMSLLPDSRRGRFWKWDWEWPWDWDIDWGKVLGGLLAGSAIAAIIIALPELAIAAAVVGLLSLIPLPEYPDPNNLA